MQTESSADTRCLLWCITCVVQVVFHAIHVCGQSVFAIVHVVYSAGKVSCKLKLKSILS